MVYTRFSITRSFESFSINDKNDLLLRTYILCLNSLIQGFIVKVPLFDYSPPGGGYFRNFWEGMCR